MDRADIKSLLPRNPKFKLLWLSRKYQEFKAGRDYISDFSKNSTFHHFIVHCWVYSL